MDVFILVATKNCDGSDNFETARVFASLDQAKCAATEEENSIISFEPIDEFEWMSTWKPGLKFDYRIIQTKVVQ